MAIERITGDDDHEIPEGRPLGLLWSEKEAPVKTVDTGRRRPVRPLAVGMGLHSLPRQRVAA
ncbi:hypothetical protein ACGFZQ_14320 [Streptomyces sp. NPDC048254]|uniref:hypothetical protein n=1 Tax=Streptomyces sp. NPDC048254 TaxID=3365525 RepID=UPI003721DC0E